MLFWWWGGAGKVKAAKRVRASGLREKPDFRRFLKAYSIVRIGFVIALGFRNLYNWCQLVREGEGF